MECCTNCCKAASVEAVNDWLTKGTRIGGNKLILVDIRGHITYQKSWIKSAVNLRFSALILRRIFRGTAVVENVCPSIIKKDIEQRKCADVILVLYDDSSSAQNIHKDIHVYAEMLQSNAVNQIYYIDGGFEKFSTSYRHLCEGTDVVNVVNSTPRKKPSLSFPLGERKHLHSKCISQSYPEEINSRPSEVLPYLYIGNAKNSADEALLRGLGVTAILNVSYNSPKHFESGFEYKKICVLDDHHADLLSQLNSAIEFIDSVKQKGGCTFVHCVAGISRSATVCIAYLMKHLCWELQRAFDFLKSRRSCVAPNLSFMGQLLAFEKQIDPNTPSRGIAVHYKDDSKYKRSSPTTEEPDVITKSSKSDHNIVKIDGSHPSAVKSKVDNRQTIDFYCNNSRCTLDARKRTLKLLPLKEHCLSVPNTV